MPFAIKLFQIINHRGLDLTIADIVKSYLLGSLNEKGNEKNYNAVKKEWNHSMELIKGLHSNDMSNYLNCYLHYILEATPKIGVASIVEKIIAAKGDEEKLRELSIPERSIKETKGSVSFATGFRKFVKNYSDVYYIENKYIYALTLLPWDTVWVPILSETAELRCDAEKKNNLYAKLLSYFYINYIANRTYNQIKQTCLTILKAIKEQKNIEEIIKTIDDEITDKLLDDFKKSILDDDVFNKKWIRNTLILIEYFSSDSKDRMVLDKDTHVEHILPVKWKTNKKGEWKHITDQVSKDYLYSLGNLTLLYCKKNVIATNDGFSTKISIYDGTHEKIKKEGPSKYKITQQIVEDYNKGIKTWDKDTIENRKDYLLGRLLDVFDIDKERFEKLGVISNK